MTNRRAFFAKTVGLVVGAVAAPLLPSKPEWRCYSPSPLTYQDIVRAQNAFWLSRPRQGCIITNIGVKEKYDTLLSTAFAESRRRVNANLYADGVCKPLPYPEDVGDWSDDI